ncbi:MAG: DUF433 domain-containing protein [Acidobacteriaceae bacterium]|nr:DUF433 domain-containing protein [Acidobacteriaceae bacterium]
MEPQDWKHCPLVSIDPETVHGEPVFEGTRMPVEDAIENYYAYRELQGLSDEEAVKATLESFPTIPGAEVCAPSWPTRPPTNISCSLDKVALDEGVPEQIADHLPAHQVRSVRQLGPKGMKNGKLLDAIEAGEFRVFITNDKRMEREQNLSRRPFAILLLSTNHWPTIEPNVAAIASAIEETRPGTVSKVDCGTCVPRRFRKPAGLHLPD